jgi:hypothetical protein
VFRGCGDHVYENADCPHCANNSAVVDKIVPVFRAQAAAHSADILKIQTQIIASETVIREARNLLHCATTFNRDALRGALAQYDRASAALARATEGQR